jgi:kinesin family member 3B
MTAKIEAMESKLLTGGKNIMDQTNEQERQLEKKREELAAQKRRQREMVQELEAKEESEMGVKETFSSLQQEMDIKKKKLKKLFSKLQSVKAEITDICESNARERRELEDIQTDLLKELKLKLLIVDHFIPRDEKSNLISRITFDEEQDDWKFTTEVNGSSGNDTFVRPTTNNSLRPVSSYSKIAASVGPAFRYKGEDIQDLDLIIREKTVKDYSAPLVSPRVRAALDSVLATEESDMILDAVEVGKASTRNEFRIIIDKKSGRPKTAMGGRSASASRPKTSLRRETSEERRPETASLFGPSGRLRR